MTGSATRDEAESGPGGEDLNLGLAGSGIRSARPPPGPAPGDAAAARKRRGIPQVLRECTGG